MNRFVPLGMLAALLVVVPILAEDKDKKSSPLEGTYTIVSGEEDGKTTPKEKIAGGKVTFSADNITGTDKDRKEFFAAAYKLDTSTKPWTITMTGTAPKSVKSVGVVEVKGDTLRICYALPGGDKPNGFFTKQKQHMFVLKRLDKDSK